MKLTDTKRKYEKGELTKADYIESMYNLHHCKLFEYRKFIRNTEINSIQIDEDNVIFSCGKHNIKIIGVEKDFRIAPVEILNFEKYEPEETEMMLKLVPVGAKVFDIGANAGWYSFVLAANDPSAHIYGFEPIPKTFENFKENCRINNFSNISIFNYGLSNKNQHLIFYYYTEGSVNASSVNVSEKKDISEVDCQVKRLDDCFSEISNRLDFIKCDVEGAELLVFQGGLQTIKKQLPIIFSEILRKWSAKFDYHPNDILTFFSKLGYKCFVVRGKKIYEITHVDENTVETNYFFLHEKKHGILIDTYSSNF